MTESSQVLPTAHHDATLRGGAAFFRSLVIALTAFLTLVDLFARATAKDISTRSDDGEKAQGAEKAFVER